MTDLLGWHFLDLIWSLLVTGKGSTSSGGCGGRVRPSDWFAEGSTLLRGTEGWAVASCWIAEGPTLAVGSAVLLSCTSAGFTVTLGKLESWVWCWPGLATVTSWCPGSYIGGSSWVGEGSAPKGSGGRGGASSCAREDSTSSADLELW